MVGVDEWSSALEYLWIPYDSGHRTLLQQKCTLRGCKISTPILAQVWGEIEIATQIIKTLNTDLIFTAVPCILMLSKSFIYQLMHSRFALKEY